MLYIARVSICLFLLDGPEIFSLLLLCNQFTEVISVVYRACLGLLLFIPSDISTGTRLAMFYMSGYVLLVLIFAPYKESAHDKYAW